jgi:D-arabinose 1-dehydrogenase-like Zn-dependent alcohol dehydrogenase
MKQIGSNTAGNLVVGDRVCAKLRSSVCGVCEYCVAGPCYVF